MVGEKTTHDMEGVEKPQDQDLKISDSMEDNGEERHSSWLLKLLTSHSPSHLQIDHFLQL